MSPWLCSRLHVPCRAWVPGRVFGVTGVLTSKWPYVAASSRSLARSSRSVLAPQGASWCLTTAKSGSIGIFIHKIVLLNRKRKAAAANVPGVSTKVAKHSCAVWTRLDLSVDSPRAGGPERSVLHCEILGSPPWWLLGSLTRNPQSSKRERAPVCRAVRASRDPAVSLLLQNRGDFPHSPVGSAICDCLVGKGVRVSLHYTLGVAGNAEMVVRQCLRDGVEHIRPDLRVLGH